MAVYTWRVSDCKGLVVGHKSIDSTDRYSHFSSEETIETGESVSRRLYV